MIAGLVGLGAAVALAARAVAGPAAAVAAPVTFLGVMLGAMAFVVGRHALVSAAAVLLATGSFLSFVPRTGRHAGVILVALLLFVYIDQTLYALELRTTPPMPVSLLSTMVKTLLFTGVVALVVAATGLPVRHGILVQAAGLGAAAAVLGIIRYLAARAASDER